MLYVYEEGTMFKKKNLTTPTYGSDVDTETAIEIDRSWLQPSALGNKWNFDHIGIQRE